MRPRRLAALLSLTLALNNPGVGGWVLFAQTTDVVYDPSTNRLRVAEVHRPVAAPTAALKLDAAVLAGRLSEEDAQRAKVLIERYGADNPDVDAALAQLNRDLDNPNKDARLTLSDLYDRMSPTARAEEGRSTYVQVLSQTSASQNVAVMSARTGATLFFQNSVDLTATQSRRVITRPDPVTGRSVVEAVVVVEEKGSADEQRVLYNRKVHVLFRNLKKLYYDQCALVRKINNGRPAGSVGAFTSEDCKIDGRLQLGFRDPDATEAQLDAMRAVYARKRRDFDDKTFRMQNGSTINLRAYLVMLDRAVADGTTENLHWKDLQEAQRLAMNFYGENQLTTMQNYVLVQLTSYFGQVTNSQPRQKKDGTEAVGAESQDPERLQEALREMEKGNLEGYGHIMRHFRLTELSHEDQKYIPPALLDAAGEAFAYVSYAVRARQRALNSPSGEEVDAAIAEGQQWLKLAQIQLQTFEIHSLTIQLERLKDGMLRDNLGLLSSDHAGKAEALRLLNVARDQYLPRLRTVSAETKRLMLKQSIATFFLGIQSAARAQLYADTVRERLRALAAKALEMKELYLASEFEKVKGNPEFLGRSALDKLRGGAYKHFREHLPPAVAALAADLERFAAALTSLTASANSDAAIRAGARGKLDEFVDLARRLGYSEIPDVNGVNQENERHSIRHAQFFAALQEHSTKMRMFDMMHELDQYVRRYGSSEIPDSDNTSGWDKFVSFKWLDRGLNRITFGARDASIEAGMRRFPLTREAYARLGGAAGALRLQVLSLMAEQQYDEAYKLLETIDPASAARSRAEWESDQVEKDPFDDADMLAFMSKTSEGSQAAVAQGVVGGLFKHLQTYILGYTGFAAGVDMVLMTVATAGVGQLARVFTAAGKGAVNMSRIMQAATRGHSLGKMTALHRLAQQTPVLTRIVSGVVNYGGKVGIAVGRNFTNTLDLKTTATTAAFVRQAVTTSVANAAVFTGRNMLIMGLASGGMQYTAYAFTKENSQYKSGWSAFGQGALGGAKFGATGGALMLFSPIPISALGNGAGGRLMQTLGTTSGPIGGAISGIAKVIPNARFSQGVIANQGLWGAAGEAALSASPAMRALANTAVWGGAMVDGALKFFLAAEIPKEILGLGHFLVDRLTSDPNDKGSHGATSYVQSLASAQHFGMSVSQAAWLLIPVNAMHAPSTMREQKEQFYGFSRIMQRPGGAAEIMETPNGQFIPYTRSGYHRLFNFEFGDLIAGRGQTQGRIQNNEQFKQMANRMDSRKSRSVPELAALSTVNAETMAGRQKLGHLVSELAGRAPPSGPSASSAGPAPVGQPSRVVGLFARAVQAKGKGAGGRPEKLYAYLTRTGALERVSTKGDGKRGVKVEVTVKADGTLVLAREGGGLTPANAAALRTLGPGARGRLEGMLSEFNASRSTPPAPAQPLTADAVGAGKILVSAGPEGRLMVEKLAGEGVVELEFATGPKGEVILARAKGGELTQGNAPALETLGPGARVGVEQVLSQFNARPSAPRAAADPSDVFVTNEGVGAWRALMEQHLGKDRAMRHQLLRDLNAQTLELTDPKTGKTFTVAGEPLSKLREMAAWRELDGASLGPVRTFKAVFFGNEGLPQGSWLGIPRKLMPWQYLANGRLWRVMTGRTVGAVAEVIRMELQQAVGSDVRSAASSPSRRLTNVRKQVEALLRTSTGQDAQALASLRDALSAPGRPEAVIRAAQAEFTRLAGGASPELLIRLKRRLSAEEAPEILVKTALELLDGVPGSAAEAVRAKLAGKGAKNPSNFTELLDNAAAELHVQAELAREAGGALPEVVAGVQRRLAAEQGPENIVKSALELLEGVEGPTADSVRAVLRGRGAKNPADFKELLDNAAAELRRATEGAPLETLAGFQRSLEGEIMAGDLIFSAAERMDASIAQAKGMQAAALQTLRRTIESDAFLRLANQRLVEGMLEYRRGGRSPEELAQLLDEFRRTGKLPQDVAKLQSSVDLLIDIWERGVFGQNFQTRVEKNGEKVWDIPAEYHFKDANGNAIKSFRQGQLDAIRNDLLAIASGSHMVYNLLQTSGGKTLMSFVLVGFIESFARARGKDGAIIATANADLVAQGHEAYKAFFKGRKPTFEIIDYGELMVRQASADAEGSLGPFETHDVIMDEFDFVGMGTPLSLGKFQGQMSFSKIDPMQAALRRGVVEAWEGLYAKYGEGVQSMSRQDFVAFRRQNPAFDKEFTFLVARTTKEVREALQALDPMLSSTWLNPSYRRFRREFISSITPEYAAEKGMTPTEIYIEMVREHRNAFGGLIKMGAIIAKYGSLEKWVEKVVEGGFEAASEGENLRALAEPDPQREGIIQYHNNQAMDSLDTHYRTSLELYWKTPLTLDFETQAVTDFKKINVAARDAGAVTVALSGTLPDGMRPFLKSIGVVVVGKGSDPNKAAGLPHHIVSPRPELVQRLEGLAPGKPVELSVNQLGEVQGLGTANAVAAGLGRVNVAVDVKADNRLTVSPRAAATLSKMTPEAVENLGFSLDLLNVSRVPNPESTPLQFAATREGILRLMADSRGKSALNIAYAWLESTAKMEVLIRDLNAHGITMEKTSILTSPGSNFFLQERYMFKVKTDKNIEGIKAGEVAVVILAGQGGLRGLEAPLQAFAGGEIRMFVTDSHTLADVSLVQLLGRIDRGRVPTNSKTSFVLLDDAATVARNRNYRETLFRMVVESAQGLESAKLAEVQRLMGGRAVDEAVVRKLFTDANLIEAKNEYRDYLTLRRIRENVPAEELAALAKLPTEAQRSAALELMERPEVMKILVVELRRLAEKDALRSSGIIDAGKPPTLWQQFLIDLQGGR